MREFGQLGVVAKKHHALQLFAELVNDDEQVIRLAGTQPIIYHDILELVIELLGDDLRRRERAHRRTRQDQIGLHIALRQSLTHLRRIDQAHAVPRAARVAGAPDRAVRRRARTLTAGRTAARAARAAHFAQDCAAHSDRPAWPSSCVISCTGTGLDCQISAQYSRIVRSEENLPERAVFRIDMRVQRSPSQKAASTCCWQSAYAL